MSKTFSSINGGPVRCCISFEEEFKEQRHIKGVRNSEKNLQIDAKLIYQNQYKNQLYSLEHNYFAFI